VANRLNLRIFYFDFTRIELLLESLRDATKHRNGNQYVPLPVSIGNYKIVNDITEEEMKLAIDVFEEI
jgi:3-dehydroquinate synthetase